MKEDRYSKLICKGYCMFFKEGKEELYCGGYKVLKDSLTLGEIQLFSTLLNQKSYDENSQDLDFHGQEFICKNCSFQLDGCDFRQGLPSPPCGGFIFIKKLISFFQS